MKRKTLLVLAATAGIVLAAGLAVLAAPSAQGTTTANGPDQRIAKLEAQMKGVQTDLKGVRASLKVANVDLKSANTFS